MAQTVADVKTKLRKLKKLELKLRFGTADLNGVRPSLVFDTFFGFRENASVKPRYSLEMLAQMDRGEFLSVVEAYMAEVFFRVYGFREGADSLALNAFDLPFGADEEAIKKRFRELAKKYHPDTGGDAERFVELKARYDELMRKKSGRTL